MIQTGVVARLAVRELWMSFRLFVVVAAFVATGAIVALAPVPLPATVGRLAAGLAASTLVAGAAAAWSMAAERRTGRAGWLVTRSVPRATLVMGWWVALVAVALAGLAAAGVLGWLAASTFTLRLEPAGYVADVAAVGAAVLAVIGVGLLVGILLPAQPAALVVVGLGLAAGALAWLGPLEASLVPGGAYVELAALREPGDSAAPGLRATGVGLTIAAIALALARAAMERAEL